MRQALTSARHCVAAGVVGAQEAAGGHGAAH